MRGIALCREPHRERGVNCHHPCIPPIRVAGFMHAANQRTPREGAVASLPMRLSSLVLSFKNNATTLLKGFYIYPFPQDIRVLYSS